MKPNVDLTLNRDFRTTAIVPLNEQALSSEAEYFTMLKEGDPDLYRTIVYPWLRHEVHSDEELAYNPEGNPLNKLILTGTKKQRKQMKEYLEVEEQTRCYRCGERIEPYMQFYIDSCLCKRCIDTTKREIENLDIPLPWNRDPE